MSKNTNLHAAKQAQKDEFYTQMSDIEIEINAYLEYDKDVFRNKVIFCNCDDPYESNFFKYFALRFNDFGLKQLIATCYSGSPVAGTQLTLFDEPTPASPQKTAYKVIINEVKDFNGDGAVDLEDIKKLLADENNIATELEGNGDFRSEECVELLEQADIVVTNPPFSLFREYLALLIDHKKKFVIIGNINAVTYKEVFPLIKNNLMWPGSRFNKRVNGKNMTFRVPDNYPMKGTEMYTDEEGIKYISVSGTCWFTNLPLHKRYEPLQLMKKNDNLRYSKQLIKALQKLGAENYPKYDNYDAIEIPITAAIPSDYKGVMGVPITFLDKYCPEQFEILGFAGGWNGNSDDVIRKYPTKQKQIQKDGKELIVGKMNDGTPQICLIEKPKNTTYYDINDGKFYLRTYGRILIRYTTQWIKDHPNDFKD